MQVDLGSAQSASRVVLQLPTGLGRPQPDAVPAGQHRRRQLQHVKASATYTFDPTANSNTVTITFTATTERYFRVNITANTGWPAGQVSEFQVWNV